MTGVGWTVFLLYFSSFLNFLAGASLLYRLADFVALLNLFSSLPFCFYQPYLSETGFSAVIHYVLLSKATAFV
jgi:hypothetical protein